MILFSVVRIPIEKTYYLTYTAVSPDGWATALATTEDFITINKKIGGGPAPIRNIALLWML